MVIALLMPVAIASRFFDRVWKIMAASMLLGIFFTLTGLAVSYTPNLPSGAVTIVMAGLTYLMTLVFSALKKPVQKTPTA